MERAKITNWVGRGGLGQQTGGDDLSNKREATEVLRMIASVRGEDARRVLDERSYAFLNEQFERANTIVTHYRVSGKQLFWLRDIKDKLIAAGVL